MSIAASTIIDKVAYHLQDVTNVRWSRVELLRWLSAGERLITVLQPSSTNTIAIVALAAGSRQAIPSDGWILLDVIRNMGTSGTTPGRSVRIVSRRLLEAFRTSWHSDTPVTEVQNYTFDMQDQTAFFVYPPSDGTGKLEINYSALPAPLTSESQSIGVPDSYEEALTHYVMFRALTKNAEWAANSQGAQYLELFNAVMGSKVSAEDANNPNLGLAPPSPQTGGVS